MKKNIIWIFVLSALLFSGLIYFYKNKKANSSLRITNFNEEIIDLKKFCISSQELLNSDIYLINVLDKELFEDFHILNSINIPFEEFTNDLIKTLNKDKTYIFYCSNYYCTASHLCAEMLIKKGFCNVYVYGGGSAEWFHLSEEFPKDYLYNGLGKQKYLKKYIIIPDDYKMQLEDQIINPHKYIKLYKILSAKLLQKKINPISYIE
jgi:rhodanese-related sulfurtransferase